MISAEQFQQELAKTIQYFNRDANAERNRHRQAYLDYLHKLTPEQVASELQQLLLNYVESYHSAIRFSEAEAQYSEYLIALFDYYVAYEHQREHLHAIFAQLEQLDQAYMYYNGANLGFIALKTLCYVFWQQQAVDVFLQQQVNIPAVTQQQLAELINFKTASPNILALNQRPIEQAGAALSALPEDQANDLLYWLVRVLAIMHPDHLAAKISAAYSSTELHDRLAYVVASAIVVEHPALQDDRVFNALVEHFRVIIRVIRERKLIQLLTKYTTQKAKKKQISAELKQHLLALDFMWLNLHGYFPAKQLEKYQQKIHDTVHADQVQQQVKEVESNCAESAELSYRLPLSNQQAAVGVFIHQQQGNVAWVEILQQEFEQLDIAMKPAWLAFWQHVETANSAKPSQKWLKAAEQIWQQAPIQQQYFDQLQHWWALIEQHSDSSTRPFDAKNETALRAILWLSTFQQTRQDELLVLLSRISEYCYRKIFAVGAASAVIGGVALNLLAQRGLAGLAKLSFLQKKISYELGQKVIRKALDQAAVQNNLSVDEIQELVAEDFNFIDGKSEKIALDDYTLQLQCMGDRRCEVMVFDAQDALFAVVPKAVLKNEQYKALKQQASQISRQLAVHAQHFETALCQQRVWQAEFWQQHILNHAVLGWFATRLIWCIRLDDGTEQIAMYENGQWLDAQQQACLNPAQKIQRLSLWHPINASTAEVQAWRYALLEQKITQPFKQAFREIYVLNDAERDETTDAGSLRFAYHYLQQSKFKAIANARGWHYDIQGGWDNFSQPHRYFAEHDINVVLNIALPEEHAAITEHGVYAYIKTQSIRFTQNGAALALEHVPALLFSEAMRDIDYFIQGCSIGLDLNLDLSQFPKEMQQYDWQGRSANNSQIVAARQLSLDLILSKLNIAAQCELDARFVYVQGKLHRYKIHIATAQVFIADNDQALCILPKKKLEKISVEHLFLPFDDDAMLSLILSQVLLLAQDDQIQDELIQQQIKVA